MNIKLDVTYVTNIKTELWRKYNLDFGLSMTNKRLILQNINNNNNNNAFIFSYFRTSPTYTCTFKQGPKHENLVQLSSHN